MNTRFDHTTGNQSSDELDQLLRAWHEENAALATARRDALLAEALARQPQITSSHAVASAAGAQRRGRRGRVKTSSLANRLLRSTPLRAAAALAIVAVIGVLFLPSPNSIARAEMLVNLPDGGRLDALDQMGREIGPCPLKHTHVDVAVSGPFSRVTIRQQYENPYDVKIEAVYTFPLSHRGAVDRMRIIIDGDRIVEGEVKEREEARQIYEAARAANHVAALLEQERPNIFTQSIANIEPGASIEVEISYIETVERIDGEYSFAFPMTVTPRYIPGYPVMQERVEFLHGRALPEGLAPRRGIVLQGPASFRRAINTEAADDQEHPSPLVGRFLKIDEAAPYVQHLLDAAVPVDDDNLWEWRRQPEQAALFERLPSFDFIVQYADGSEELGQLSGDGAGHVNGRWFWVNQDLIDDLTDDLRRKLDHAGNAPARPAVEAQRAPGAPFAPNTAQVPDASRITPMPVHPSMRAGHDISITVTIDTGGPAITWVESELHELDVDGALEERDVEDRSRLRTALRNDREIPNRDFVLKWRVEDESISESTFVHAGENFAERGGYFTLILAPPARVEAEDVAPRELIFVLDTSGSMSGEPLAKAQSVLSRAIDAMRPGDTFNVITFSGHTRILWPEPRPSTDANRAEALAMVNSRTGGGGTEMMQAIEAALKPTDRDNADARTLAIEDVANLPADGRNVAVIVDGSRFTLIGTPSDFVNTRDGVRFGDNGIMPVRGEVDLATLDRNARWLIKGRWVTDDGERWLEIDSVEQFIGDGDDQQPARVRICMFLTDGHVGNDHAIIDAVKRYAGTTRVFSFGIGNSVNRYLLANMAHAARGEVEFVTQQGDRADAVERFVRRIESPLLVDIDLEFGEGLDVMDILPLTPGGLIPDVYDERPIVIHGRYMTAGRGALTIRGRTAHGRYERTMEIELPEHAAEHDVIAALWARSKVEELTNLDLSGLQHGTIDADLKKRIVEIGVSHGIMTPFTSFVAVEKARVTIDGKPMLVHVPIELPNDTQWEGFFCETGLRGDVIADAVNGWEERTVSETFANLERLNSAIDVLSQIDRAAINIVGLVDRDLSDTLRQGRITDMLSTVRELQLNRQYPAALLVIDQILLLEPGNPVALALRDAIQTSALWHEFMESNSEDAREFAYSWQLQDNREATIAPQPDSSDAALRQRVEELEAQILRLGQSGESEEWLTQERAAEIKLLVQDILTSANDGENLRVPLRGRGQYRISMSFADSNEVARTIRYGYGPAEAPQLAGPRSSSGQMSYPQDWPAFSLSAITGTEQTPPPPTIAPPPNQLSEDSALGSTFYSGQQTVFRTQLPLLFGDETDDFVTFDSSDLIQVDFYGVALGAPGDGDLRYLADADPQHWHRPVEQGEGASSASNPVEILVERIGAIEKMTQRFLESPPAEAGPDVDGAAGGAGHEQRTSVDVEAAAARFALAALVDASDPASASFQRERASVLIRLLVAHGHIREARLIAGWLHTIYADDTDVSQLAAALAGAGDESDPDAVAALKREIDEIASRVRLRIAKAIAQRALEHRVARVLSDELQQRIASSQAQDESSPEVADEDSVTVALLVSSVDDESIGALRELGVEIISTSPRAMLHVGRARIEDLVAIALEPAVRRIELARTLAR